jgi:hypothetical protein
MTGSNECIPYLVLREREIEIERERENERMRE